MPGSALGREAELWWLHPEELESTNEHDWAPSAPEVTIRGKRLDGFRSVYRLDLPLATIMTLRWEEAG